jgi:UDP-N-acetylmuramoyl-tripeptide--D-alanyl-D-alanine ligase
MDPLPLHLLAEPLDATLRGCAGELLVRRVCIDSREVRPGDLFWALLGEHHDSHRFVGQALAAGAVAAVVDAAHAPQLEGPRLVVRQTLPALQQLAAWYRRRQEALVIGVTGSVGKTTTREMLHAVLSSTHPGLRSRKNFNNEIGLPLSLLDLGSEHEFAVIEMGAGRRGDIRALCDIAAPEVGVLTRIGPAHLESFGSLDAIYEGKFELVDALPCTGFAVVGGDDPRMRQRARQAACAVRLFGERPENDIVAEEVEFRPGRLRFSVRGDRFQLAATARHQLTSALAALAVAREIGLTTSEIQEGFDQFQPPASRCRVETIGPWTVIDDSYNASPLAMQAACELLRDWPTEGQRLLIFGDMLELGPASAGLHHQLGRQVAGCGVDRLLVCGEFAGDVARGALEGGLPLHQIACCDALETLYPLLDCWLTPGDVLLVKGSRGMRMERTLTWLRQQTLHLTPFCSPLQPAAA